MANSIARMQQLGSVPDLNQQLEEYDYVKMTYVDINGETKTALLPINVAKRHMENGLEIYAGAVSLGTHGEVITTSSVEENHFFNAVLVPDCSTLHVIPQRQATSLKICQVFGETWWDQNTPQDFCPRYMARTQLKRLADKGYTYYSGTEFEFCLLDKVSGKPLYADGLYFSSDKLAEIEPWLLEVMESLKQTSVPVYSAHVEHGPGQFEIPTGAEFGITSADHGIIFMQCVKEITAKHGYSISFMAQPIPPQEGVLGSGTHHNFSIWDKDQKKNMFWKEEGGLSDMAYHWIAGLMKHGPALTALTSPTPNCYRRLHCFLTPTYSNWGIDSRFATIRAKNKSQSMTYIENRLPSPKANLYLVMAATIAAGMDGMEKKLPCPKENLTDSDLLLPKTLEEALTALREDEVMVEVLGKEFIDLYCQLRMTDLKAIREANNFEAEMQRFR